MAVVLALILLLLPLTGCRTQPMAIPKPQPIDVPIDPQTAINTLIAKPTPPPTPPSVTPALTGVVTRKALAQWLIEQTGGMRKLAQTPVTFHDVADPAFSTMVTLSSWGRAFFMQGRQPQFKPNHPVNRETFCVLASLLAGQYPSLQNVPDAILDSWRPPGGKPFNQFLDGLQISPLARSSVAWAYKEALLAQAFAIDGATIDEVGLHPGQSTQWDEIKPSLLFLLARNPALHYHPPAPSQAKPPKSANKTPH
jgi:hypothetical protein